MKIEILDAAMSCGKSTGIIQWMLDNPQNKYLYIAPLLDEVEERIPEKCAELEFVSPNTHQHKTKAKHLLELLEEGYNTCFTHNLFKDLTREHLYWIKLHGYVLIMDEEVSFIDPYGKFTKGDIISLEKRGLIEVDEQDLGRVIWKWDDIEENTQYSPLKRMCDLQMVYCAKRSRDMMVIHLPIELITSASRVIVSTYLFEGSIMDSFMRMKGVTYTQFNEAPLIRTTEEVLQMAREKINFIAPTRSSKKVSKWKLHHTWWSKEADASQVRAMDAAIRSLCRATKTPRAGVMWTVPKDNTRANSDKRGRKVTVSGYSSEECYVACNCKATNKLAHKTVLIHAYNRFPPQVIKAYLDDYGFPVNADQYALSELVQWVWRSAIRNEEPIQVAILSTRMDAIFKAWLLGEKTP
jgi:hypothetical protein